jgi:phosphoribosyl-ATP pyrophosphohydrolase
MSDTEPPDPVLDDLFAVIQHRLAERPDGSYTVSLVDGEKGADRALEKVGEEAVEVVLAAKNDDGDALAAESADLVYHLLVVLAANGVDLEQLRAELRERR